MDHFLKVHNHRGYMIGLLWVTYWLLIVVLISEFIYNYWSWWFLYTLINSYNSQLLYFGEFIHSYKVFGEFIINSWVHLCTTFNPLVNILTIFSSEELHSSWLRHCYNINFQFWWIYYYYIVADSDIVTTSIIYVLPSLLSLSIFV